jgi:hypothetical protein
MQEAAEIALVENKTADEIAAMIAPASKDEYPWADLVKDVSKVTAKLGEPKVGLDLSAEINAFYEKEEGKKWDELFPAKAKFDKVVSEETKREALFNENYKLNGKRDDYALNFDIALLLFLLLALVPVILRR